LENVTPMRPVLAALVTIVVMSAGVTLAAQQPVPPQPASPAVPGAQQPPGTPPQAPGGTQTTLIPTASREFTTPVGLLFNTVRPERVADFEKVIAYLQAALAKATDPVTVEQAKGWKVFKATEPGPNGTVMYVFVLDPAVPKADYGLGRILADAYPDTVQLQEIWKLYTSSVTGGGSLLNLTPTNPVLPVPEK
jgi:hypothetical protein